MREDRIAAVEAGLRPRTPVEEGSEIWTLEERMRAYTVPGLSIAVFRDGELDWAKGYGLCEAGDASRPVTDKTLFQAASLSKPVCAAAVLQLVAEGRLDLDAPINDVLTTWSLPENDCTRASPVTLRRILSHTAGLNVHGFEGFEQGRPLPSVYQILNGAPPAQTPSVRAIRVPGTASQYSGGGTTIAQLVVMEQRRQAFDEAVQTYIFEPLGIKGATFRQPLPEHLAPRAASGHRPGPVVLPGKWRNLPQLGAGGLWTAPADYARFLMALRQAWAGASDAILPVALAGQMMSRQEHGPFGLGPRIFGTGQGLRFEHGGSQQGYQCESVCFLERGDGAVVMTNSDLGSPLAFEILNAIAEVYGWPDYLRRPRTSLSLPDSELEAYVGTYRITYGLDAEFIGVRRDGASLYTMMDQVPDTPILLASRAELFSQLTPYDARLEFGADGRVRTIRIYEEDLLILEAVRDDRHQDWRPVSRAN